MGIYSIKPAFQRRLRSVSEAAVRAGIRADVLTILGGVMSVLGAVCLASIRQIPLFALGVPVFAFLRTALNALDGMVAVSSGSARPFGEVLNESIDRISDVAWFTGMAFVIDPRLALGTLVIVMVGSFLGVVTKAAGGKRIYQGVMGKADRMIVLSAGSIASLFWPPVTVFTVAAWVIATGAILTIAQRFLIAHRDLT